MHLPTSTYRIQLNSEFTFEHLDNIIDYLHKLGVGAVYAAPIFQSTPGSNHGYDVSDPHKLNSEIGTEDQLKVIAAKLKSKEMLWVQDIVPNHMAYTTDNTRLMDVFERGPHSPYYHYFDINWNHFEHSWNGKLMVPFLGKELKEAVTDGDITLAVDELGLFINCMDTRYPLSVLAYRWLAEHIDTMEDSLNPEVQKFLYRFYELSDETKTMAEWQAGRAEFMKEFSSIQDLVSPLLDSVNKEPASLMKLLDNQYYRFTYWRTTEKAISYRRFFTVNSLICLSMQDEQVFEEYHQYIFDLYTKGYFQGLRIDHIDGLQDPKAYVDMLREKFGKDCYIVAEKILEAHEDLPADWQLEGTSGYEFLADISQLFTNKAGGTKLLNYYHEHLQAPIDYNQLVFEKKQLILRESMQGELENLLNLLGALDLIPEHVRSSERFRKALGLLMAAFPVYRTYPDSFPLRNADFIDQAFLTAKSGGEELDEEFELLLDLFNNDHVSTEESENRLTFLKRLMQYTGPLAAKGVEDTTFYLYNPLISHNEVGDSPSVLGISIDDFHHKMLRRQERVPLSMNASSTHDTKRGEDARLRINVLSEFAEEWIELVEKWREANKALKSTVDGATVPSVNEEYFIYQALIGGFPENFEVNEELINRLQSYMNKVLREAKEHTGWAEPNTPYEEGVSEFIRGILSTSHSFLDSALPFIRKITERAQVYSLGQALIKLTAPGIPDIYQGCECWDLSFVDPDNRRAVNYELRKEILAGIVAHENNADELTDYLDQHESVGARKLFVLYKLLHLRRKYPELFNHGEYLPLQASANAETIISYARVYKDEWLIVGVPIGQSLNKENGNAEKLNLPEGAPTRFVDVFTGKEYNLNGGVEMNSSFPVVCLKSLKI